MLLFEFKKCNLASFEIIFPNSYEQLVDIFYMEH